MTEKKKVVVVAGAGPGNGAALARRFADGGYTVALLARDIKQVTELARQIDGAVAYACDVSDAESVTTVFNSVVADLGVVDILLFNAGSGVFKSVEDIQPADFENAWRVNALGSLLCSQAVIPAMKAQGRGVILFTGATASLRGGKTTAAFAPAKSAQRSLAESMARSLWPAGIHVGLIIVDGIVDIPATRNAMPTKSDDFFVDPKAFSDTAWFLAHQDRRAWSFELEARPFGEIW